VRGRRRAGRPSKGGPERSPRAGAGLRLRERRPRAPARSARQELAPVFRTPLKPGRAESPFTPAVAERHGRAGGGAVGSSPRGRSRRGTGRVGLSPGLNPPPRCAEVVRWCACPPRARLGARDRGRAVDRGSIRASRPWRGASVRRSPGACTRARPFRRSRPDRGVHRRVDRPGGLRLEREAPGRRAIVGRRQESRGRRVHHHRVCPGLRDGSSTSPQTPADPAPERVAEDDHDQDRGERRRRLRVVERAEVGVEVEADPPRATTPRIGPLRVL